MAPHQHLKAGVHPDEPLSVPHVGGVLPAENEVRDLLRSRDDGHHPLLDLLDDSQAGLDPANLHCFARLLVMLRARQVVAAERDIEGDEAVGDQSPLRGSRHQRVTGTSVHDESGGLGQDDRADRAGTCLHEIRARSEDVSPDGECLGLQIKQVSADLNGRILRIRIHGISISTLSG